MARTQAKGLGTDLAAGPWGMRHTGSGEYRNAPPRSGTAGGRKVECPGQGSDNPSIIEIVVKAQFQAGYTVSPSGACFSSPFFLLAAIFPGPKTVPGKKSIGNLNATRVAVASSGTALGCYRRGSKTALGTPDYVFGLDRVSQRRSGVSRYFLADGQGSVRMLSDSIGAVTDSNYYTAFSEDLFHSGSTVNDFRYVGEQLDPNSGLHYNQARWGDPSTGRFESVDPYEGEPETPVSLHRYLYANASLVSFSDPTGRESYVGAPSALSVNSVLFNVGQVITSAAARSLGQFIVKAGATVALTYATNEISKFYGMLLNSLQSMLPWLALSDFKFSQRF